jgi:integrase
MIKMGLYRRGKNYWFNITYQGKRIQKSTDTDNKKLAEKIYAKTLIEIVEGRYFDTVKAKRITFSEMIDKYMQRYEKSRDRYSIKKLLPAFGHMTLAEITTEMTSDYMDDRLKKVEPATVYQELALMRRMYNVARRQWKWTKENPVADLSFSVGNENARDRWLTVEEEEILLKAATNPGWLKSMLIVALHTGMRRGEILKLKWQDLNFSRRLVMVQKSKNREKRTIPMSKTLHGILFGQKVRDISGRVFPLSVRSLREAFRKTLSKTDIKDFKFHDLRHTFATRLVQNGVDLYKVKELLGHKTISMTMRYAHHYPESLRASVEVLDDCYNSATIVTTDLTICQKNL